MLHPSVGSVCRKWKESCSLSSESKVFQLRNSEVAFLPRIAAHLVAALHSDLLELLSVEKLMSLSLLNIGAKYWVEKDFLCSLTFSADVLDNWRIFCDQTQLYLRWKYPDTAWCLYLASYVRIIKIYHQYNRWRYQGSELRMTVLIIVFTDVLLGWLSFKLKHDVSTCHSLFSVFSVSLAVI